MTYKPLSNETKELIEAKSQKLREKLPPRPSKSRFEFDDKDAFENANAYDERRDRKAMEDQEMEDFINF